ncbi:protein DYAD-like [Primulina tabacum]|uniref:protein DYAD-like n=1 Tax=Primulina tabacum TaxID=48773 RepID=UPI003F5A86AF
MESVTVYGAYIQIKVMETYYRKRSRKALQINPVTEMEPLAEQGGGNDAGKSLCFGRHNLVPPPPTSHHCSLLLKGDEKDKDDMQKHIQVGALYEIDHIHLPPRTPVQLRSVRVAMVCEKTKLNVAVRFPSMESLTAFFSYTKRETHPALDEKFVMGLALSEKVLFRLVSAEKFAEKRCSENFWLISSSVGSFRDKQEGYCLSELKGNGMVRWGIRRQVKYLGRHKSDENDDNGGKIDAQNSSSSFVTGFEEIGMKLRGVGDKRKFPGGEEGHEESDTDVIEVEEKIKEEEDQDMGEEEDIEENIEEGDEDDEEDNIEEGDEEDEEEKIPEAEWNLKRKRYSTRNISTKKRKKEMTKTKNWKQVDQKKNRFKRNKNGIKFKEARVLQNPKDRWSAERYKLAEQNLLEVMKVKGAMAENPILRPQLRTEARKRIGDTGLLDHLLKHMAGKLAPGGKERFRRRHNADGAMEYWLESADLVNVRRDAGITDPYWVPPPGWKPGDSPTQDPICANEIKLLKDNISNIKRDHLKLVATNKQLEEEIVKLKRELDELSCKRKLEENQSVALISNGSGNKSDQKLDQLAVKLVPPKCDLAKSPLSMETFEEQLMAISYFVKEMKKKFGKLMTPNEEERERTDFPLMAPTDQFKSEKDKTKNKQPQAQEISTVGDEISDFGEKPAFRSSPSADQKAAKIQRLKSGFRICKPQGTFLWPNMVKNYSTPCANMSPQPDQVLVQVEVPTPPSVSSSTASAPPQLPYQHLLHPSPPVKPFAERGAVAVSLPTVPEGTNIENVGANIFSTATVINPKKVPNSPNHVIPLMSTVANIKVWEGCVYEARNAMEFVNQRQQNACCSSSASSLASEVGNWLALSAPKSGSDEST